MLRVPDGILGRFEAAMTSAQVDRRERWQYGKWLRYYLDFCSKYQWSPEKHGSLEPFIEKLASKNQSVPQRHQAARAVRLYLDMRQRHDQAADKADATPGPRPAALGHASEAPAQQHAPAPRPATRPQAGGSASHQRAAPLRVRETPPPVRPAPAVAGLAAKPPRGRRQAAQPSRGVAQRVDGPPSVGAVDRAPPRATGASWVKVLDELRNAIRLRNYSPRTSKTYTHWTRRFQTYTRSKPPDQLTTEDVKGFLTKLAVKQNVSASTQNQAFNALLFFFRHVLGKEFGKVEGVVRAKRRRYIPVVLSREEVDRVVAGLEHPFDLVVLLLYGCGLRISEALDLRIQCFNLDENVLTVHDGKGQKDRTVPLPKSLLPRIRGQFARVEAQLREDLGENFAGAFLPRQLEKKYPKAGREFIWQWFFPAKQLTYVQAKGEHRRYHMLDSDVQRAVKRAADETGITKRVTPHTFRHTFASHLLLANVDIRTIQERLGHSDVKTTMIYTHTVPSRTFKDAGSPLDFHPRTEESAGQQP
jgi:integron integrase